MGVSIGQGVGAHPLTHVNKGGAHGSGLCPAPLFGAANLSQKGPGKRLAPFSLGAFGGIL